MLAGALVLALALGSSPGDEADTDDGQPADDISDAPSYARAEAALLLLPPDGSYGGTFAVEAGLRAGDLGSIGVGVSYSLWPGSSAMPLAGGQLVQGTFAGRISPFHWHVRPALGFGFGVGAWTFKDSGVVDTRAVSLERTELGVEFVGSDYLRAWAFARVSWGKTLSSGPSRSLGLGELGLAVEFSL